MRLRHPKGEWGASGVYGHITIDRNANAVVYLPGQIEKRLRKLLRDPFHVRFIMCARAENPDVVRVFVYGKGVDSSEESELLLRVRQNFYIALMSTSLFGHASTVIEPAGAPTIVRLLP